MIGSFEPSLAKQYFAGTIHFRMNRIIIITDSYSCFAPKLIETFLSVLSKNKEVSASAVIDVGTSDLSRIIRRYATWSAIRLFNSMPQSTRPGRPGKLKRICRRFGVPLLHLPGVDINRTEFSHLIKNEFQANLVLSIDCLQVFSSDLLAQFDAAVNYHNGILPAYRGLRTTEWALYHGDSRVGFSFHYMNDRLDEGNILVSDSIPVDKMIDIQELEDRKTACAAGYCEKVVEMMKQRDPGTPQTGEPGYYSRRKFMNIRKIGNPSTLTWDELEKRVRYFGPVSLNLNDWKLPVSNVVMDDGDSPFHFITLDGVTALATRFFYLPYPLYSLANRARLIP